MAAGLSSLRDDDIGARVNRVLDMTHALSLAN